MPRALITNCILLLCSFTTQVYAVVYGNLETLWQISDFDSCSGYAEQKIDLGYRSGETLSGGFLGYLRSGRCGQSQLQRLFVQRNLETDQHVSIKIGRFERIDATGYYHLDGAQLTTNAGSYGWQLYAGKPRRFTYYAAPTNLLSAEERLPGSRVAGGRFSFQLPNWKYSEKDSVYLTFEGRHFFGDEESETRLDSAIQGRWYQPWSDVYQFDLNGGLSVGLSENELVSFDWLARVHLSKTDFISLGGMTFDPPEVPVSFAERYARFYARGSQSQWMLNWQRNFAQNVMGGVRLKHIVREQQPNGFSVETYGKIDGGAGWSFEGKVGHLDVGDERRSLIYLESSKPLSSTRLLDVSVSLTNENGLLSGKKRVAAFKLSHDWLIKRGLTLTINMEKAWVDYQSYSDSNSDYRVFVKLKYALPASGAENYR